MSTTTKRGVYFSGLSTILSLLSVFVTPVLVYINYSFVGSREAVEHLESTFGVAPIIYFALILGGISCGILGLVDRGRNRLGILLSILGLLIAVLSLILFGGYMFSLFDTAS